MPDEVVKVADLNTWIEGNKFPLEEVVPPEPIIQPPPQAAGYVLAFNDEFTDLSVSHSFVHDGKKWYTETEPCCVNGGRSWPHVLAPTKVEDVPALTIVDGTVLRMRLTKVNGVWYGVSISATDRDNQLGFAQKYGYWEARLAGPPGNGPWWSFWALSQARMGPPGVNGMYTQEAEIDILESWGAAPAFWSILHDWKADPDWHLQANKSQIRSPALYEMHTYGMMWDELKMSFWFDDVKQAEVTTPVRFKQTFFPIFDIGMGGGYPTTETPDPSDLLVDWVRIWRKP